MMAPHRRCVDVLYCAIQFIPQYEKYRLHPRKGNTTKHYLTHWGRMTHISVSKLSIIGSDNGFVAWLSSHYYTNAEKLLIQTSGTNFIEISDEMHAFSFNTMRLKTSFAKSWWRHQMKIFSASLALCAGNSPVPGEFCAQRPATRSFVIFFDLRPNKRLSKQCWDWWFETPSSPLWSHCNGWQFFSASMCWM